MWKWESSKHVILGGFKQNGLQIRIQREKLCISTSPCMVFHACISCMHSMYWDCPFYALKQLRPKAMFSLLRFAGNHLKRCALMYWSFFLLTDDTTCHICGEQSKYWGQKIFPEGFKSCFDIAKRKSSKNAADPAKKYGFWKYMIFHYAKTLEI